MCEKCISSELVELKATGLTDQEIRFKCLELARDDAAFFNKSQIEEAGQYYQFVMGGTVEANSVPPEPAVNLADVSDLDAATIRKRMAVAHFEMARCYQIFDAMLEASKNHQQN